jgi:hypothetical protein
VLGVTCNLRTWKPSSGGHPHRATLAVARKLVTYLLAVDKSGQSFQLRAPWPEGGAEKEGTQKIKTA